MKVHKCGVVVKACPNSAITPAFVHIPLSYFAKLCYNSNLYEYNSNKQACTSACLFNQNMEGAFQACRFSKVQVSRW